MAALLLSAAGASAGSFVLGPVGAIAGRIFGALAGSVVDQALFTRSVSRSVEGPRLSDLNVMASTEGAPMPRVYGRARLAGQVIWATALEEVVSTSSDQAGGGKGLGAGGSATVTSTTYSYFANFAVGLCDGEIGKVLRIWADGKLLDLTSITMRFYSGGESQTADPLIVAKEGAAPAYRGTAYVVFERLPLANFGNRLPQLSFEIVRPVGRLEQMTRAVTLIPGSTEFGYEPGTVTQIVGPGQYAPENRHLAHAQSDIEASLDELQAICPNLERVAVVVAWFGDDLRAGHCSVRPCVDSTTKNTFGGTWSVAGLTRATATAVSSADGRPAFGGTPSDDSVTHLITALAARGLKTTLYPFLMMDIPSGNALPDPYSGASSQPVYPWRGRITCDPAAGVGGSPDGTAAAATQLANFFTGAEWNYRRMILHYAGLAAAAGGVDAFVIGSELRGLTRVRSASGVYPGVTALASLAGEVKTLLGPTTVVTYGADWTEYGAHVVDADAHEVRFPLDALWASSGIDAIGVDYYAPLADWRDSGGHADGVLASSIYDRDYLAGNLQCGEAYDWYYADAAARDAQTRTAISDGHGKPWIFRQKDLWNWWSQPHYERVGGAELGSPTAWVPQGKPIWLTEIGCPAVDKGANQPSVFPDARSSENGLPYFSNGQRDDLIQRRMLEAVLGAFDPEFGANDAFNPVSTVYGERMVAPDGIHLWTWDARPYPQFPAALDVWSDGVNWETGHWLTGRLGSAPLDALVPSLLADCGIAGIDASALGDAVDGYVIDRPMTPRAMLDPLAQMYAFDAREQDAGLTFAAHGSVPLADYGEDDLVLADNAAPVTLTRAQETELPREVSIGYTDAGSDYRRAAVRSRRLAGHAARQSNIDVAVVTSGAAAARRADIWLQDLWAGREQVQFALPPSAQNLTPGDVIAITSGGRRRLLEIGSIVDADRRTVSARSIDPEVFNRPLPPPQRRAPSIPAPVAPVHASALDLPAIGSDTTDTLLRFAIFADPWPGAVTVWRASDGVSFEPIATAPVRSVVGETLDALAAGPLYRWDQGNSFRVRLYGGSLTSRSDEQVLAGGNAAAVQRADGAWEVIQFATAELVGDRTYRLSRLLRGQSGTAWAMGDPLAAGAPFVLLDKSLVAAASGLDNLARDFQFRLIVNGRDYGDPATLSIDVTTSSNALKPYAPVHLRARRGGTGVMLSWIRRTRRDGDNWLVEVPLGEDGESYEVEVLSGSTVLRTLTSDRQDVLYSSADELADFGSPQSALSIAVYQISSTVGRGFAAAATLTL